MSRLSPARFFYYSHDARYIIKTQTQAESKFLRKILPQYYAHLEKYPKTLIARFFGMHRVKMAFLGSEMHFVVMESVLKGNHEIHEIYDIKGSTVGRRAKPGSIAKGAVGKDLDLLDFVHKDHKLKIGTEKKEALIKQLQIDAEFLAGLGIMDYSLLLGIQHRQKAHMPGVHRRSVSLRDGLVINHVGSVGEGNGEGTPATSSISHSDAAATAAEAPVAPPIINIGAAKETKHEDETQEKFEEQGNGNDDAAKGDAGPKKGKNPRIVSFPGPAPKGHLASTLEKPTSTVLLSIHDIMPEEVHAIPHHESIIHEESEDEEEVEHQAHVAAQEEFEKELAANGDIRLSARRGTYFGTYSPAQAKAIQLYKATETKKKKKKKTFNKPKAKTPYEMLLAHRNDKEWLKKHKEQIKQAKKAQKLEKKRKKKLRMMSPIDQKDILSSENDASAVGVSKTRASWHQKVGNATVDGDEEEDGQPGPYQAWIERDAAQAQSEISVASTKTSDAVLSPVSSSTREAKTVDSMVIEEEEDDEKNAVAERKEMQEVDQVARLARGAFDMFDAVASDGGVGEDEVYYMGIIDILQQ